MTLIPAGEFQMGSDKGEADERPVHKVRLSAFYMDRCEVTQKDFVSLMVANPSKFKGTDRPVERVSWGTAIRYCNARSQKEGLRPCYDLGTQTCDFSADGYRLPTEAEWEYACRAGTATEFPIGANGAALPDCAWYKPNAGMVTHPVGQKRPNPWGLCDMLGNVSEWCNDGYDPTAYSLSAAAEPKGPASSDYRVVRGGNWKTGESRCRSAARQGESPQSADACLGYEVYGFRCVRAAPPS